VCVCVYVCVRASLSSRKRVIIYHLPSPILFLSSDDRKNEMITRFLSIIDRKTFYHLRSPIRMESGVINIEMIIRNNIHDPGGLY